MTPIPNSTQALLKRPGALIVPTGWPTCDLSKLFPEAARWQSYEWAKQQRAFLEQHGWSFEEPYDEFVRRITWELNL